MGGHKICEKITIFHCASSRQELAAEEPSLVVVMFESIGDVPEPGNVAKVASALTPEMKDLIVVVSYKTLSNCPLNGQPNTLKQAKKKNKKVRRGRRGEDRNATSVESGPSEPVSAMTSTT